MTDLRKAAEMALEALEWNYGTDLENIENCMAWLDKMNATIPALRQALSQPEQRPVGTYEGVMETMLSLRKGTFEQQQIYTHMKDKLLYAAPLKREWVGLTDEQIYEHEWWDEETAFAVNKELKEKNT